MKRKDLILKTALETFNKQGYEHVSTYDISRKLKISQGNLTYHFPTKQQLINSLAKIEAGSIINSGAIIEHEVKIGKFSHVGPNATLCGNVNISDNVFIGANSVVKEGVKIGKNSIIGAGSVVLKNVPANSTYVGNPAIKIK